MFFYLFDNKRPCNLCAKYFKALDKDDLIRDYNDRDTRLHWEIHRNELALELRTQDQKLKLEALNSVLPEWKIKLDEKGCCGLCIERAWRKYVRLQDANKTDDATEGAVLSGVS